MNLGQLNLCVRVKSVSISTAFYLQLGFEIFEGSSKDGWVVMKSGTTRIGLFEQKFMGDDLMSMNFRGADVRALANNLTDAGVSLSSPLREHGTRGGSCSIHDPDGNLIFFESSDQEIEASDENELA